MRWGQRVAAPIYAEHLDFNIKGTKPPTTGMEPDDGTYPPDLTYEEEEYVREQAWIQRQQEEKEERERQASFVDAPHLYQRAKTWMERGRQPDGKVMALGPIPIGSAITGGPRPATNHDMLVGVTVTDSVEIPPARDGDRPRWEAWFVYT